MADDQLVASIRTYLEALRVRGVDVRFGVLFGSMAHDAAHAESDIDLVIVSPRFDGERRREDIGLLWRVAAAVDSRIEPIPCGEAQWREDDSSAIIEVARREGRRIALPYATPDAA